MPYELRYTTAVPDRVRIRDDTHDNTTACRVDLELYNIASIDRISHHVQYHSYYTLVTPNACTVPYQ